MKIDAGDGARLNVEVAGPDSAPPLVLSNSLGTNLHMWDPQVAALTKNFRLIRYDQRGHGQSDAPATVYSIERLANDVLAILDHFKIGKTDFCGLSMGGFTGQWLARFHPGRLNRLVLANTAAKSQTPHNWNLRISNVKKGGIEAIADTVLGIWMTKEYREKNPNIAANMRAMMVATNVTGYVGCCGAIRDMDQRWGAQAIKTPTLIICGRQDNATPPKDSDFLLASIAGSKLVTLDAGHISNVERAEEFTGALETFLK